MKVAAAILISVLAAMILSALPSAPAQMPSGRDVVATSAFSSLTRSHARMPGRPSSPSTFTKGASPSIRNGISAGVESSVRVEIRVDVADRSRAQLALPRGSRPMLPSTLVVDPDVELLARIEVHSK